MLGTYVLPSMTITLEFDLFPYDRNTYHNVEQLRHLLLLVIGYPGKLLTVKVFGLDKIHGSTAMIY